MEKNQPEEIKDVKSDIRSESRIKSYVRRDSRITKSQIRALSEYFPQYGLLVEKNHLLDLNNVFAHKAPIFLEIGFGSGQSLIALAKLKPDMHFIGIETHKPGIGALLLGIARENLNNVRVLHGDAFDILQNNIADHVLAGIQIFFPDPWPKRRHHVRRLIQCDFINVIANKLQSNGTLHLATDWDDYAAHMLQVLGKMPQFVDEGDQSRSIYRPIVSKFEARALREGRKIWDLKYRVA